jgi:opacity protein-like surface antigen
MGNTSLTLALALALSGTAMPATAMAEDGDWTGFRVGLDVGQTRGDVRSDAALSGLWDGDMAAPIVADALSGDASASATGFGLRVGYDHQFANRWVVGIEADYRQPGVDESTSRTATLDLGEGGVADLRATTSTTIDRAYSIRPRVGYAAGDLLWYVSAGYARTTAEARSNYEYAIPALSSSFRKNGGASISSGGVVWGVGLDWRFSEHWDAGLRYSRSKGESAGYTLSTVSADGLYVGAPLDLAVERVSQRFDYDDIALSINYRF